MKKKFRLLLPILLPLLGGCFVWDNYGNYGPYFEIEELQNKSEPVSFLQSQGIDLTVHYGFYNVKDEKPITSKVDFQYLFLISNGYEDDSFDVLYWIDAPYADCYYSVSPLNKEREYSKSALLHMGFEKFSIENDDIRIVLGSIPNQESKKDTYNSDEVEVLTGTSFSYSVNDSVVTLK